MVVWNGLNLSDVLFCNIICYWFKKIKTETDNERIIIPTSRKNISILYAHALFVLVPTP